METTIPLAKVGDTVYCKHNPACQGLITFISKSGHSVHINKRITTCPIKSWIILTNPINN